MCVVLITSINGFPYASKAGGIPPGLRFFFFFSGDMRSGISLGRAIRSCVHELLARILSLAFAIGDG